MSPEYVRPYVKAQKNDDRDAEAIAEAATRPTMRFVELKSEEQLDMQTLHRARDRLVGERTALDQPIARHSAGARHHGARRDAASLEQHLAAMLGSDSDASLSARMRQLIDDMRAEWLELDRRIAALDNEFAARARNDAACAAARDHPRHRRAERDRAGRRDRQRRNLRARTRSRGLARAWCRARSPPGGKPRLVGITKRGNKYLRKLLIHGARSALPTLATSATPLGDWLRGLCRACTRTPPWSPLANKLARIVWAVLAQRRGVRRRAASAA